MWLKVRIYSGSGEPPGEYTEGVALSTVPSYGARIKMKIMGYVPENYHSAGAVVLNTEMAETE